MATQTEKAKTPGGTEVDVPVGSKVDEIVAKPDQLIPSTTGQLGTLAEATTAQAKETGLEVATPTATQGIGQIQAVSEVAPDIAKIGGPTVTQGAVSQQAQVTPVQGTVSQQAIAKAATEELDKKATMEYQLDQLYKSLDGTSPPPAWASSAIRKVNGIMNARGIGASSMASAAITQAIMESGVPIAAQDAQKYANIQLQNLTNKQQTALRNATTFASMDMANLNSRQQAAVMNAQSFLAMDMANLDNQQKANLLDYQTYASSLLTDTAAENARRQFNAKSEAQVEQFFAELGAQVEAANTDRVASMSQFNTTQSNAMAQFNTQTKDSRQKFESNMAFAISQSNAAWRRQINTINTAAQNQSNMLAAQQLYGLSMQELSNAWQKERDDAAYSFKESENEKDRAQQTAIAAMEIEAEMQIADDTRNYQGTASLTESILRVIEGILTP